MGTYCILHIVRAWSETYSILHIVRVWLGTYCILHIVRVWLGTHCIHHIGRVWEHILSTISAYQYTLYPYWHNIGTIHKRQNVTPYDNIKQCTANLTFKLLIGHCESAHLWYRIQCQNSPWSIMPCQNHQGWRHVCHQNPQSCPSSSTWGITLTGALIWGHIWLIMSSGYDIHESISVFKWVRYLHKVT